MTKIIKEPLPIGKIKRIPVLFKDKFWGKIMKLIVGVRGKSYAYLKYDDSHLKKAKRTKNA